MSKLTVSFVAVGGLIVLAGVVAVVIGGLTELDFSGALLTAGIGAAMIGVGVAVVGWALGALLRPRAVKADAEPEQAAAPTATAATPVVAPQPTLGVGVPAASGYGPTGIRPAAEAVPVTTGSLPVVGAGHAAYTAAQPEPAAEPTVAAGQFPVATGQFPVVTGQFPVVTGQLPVVTGQFPAVAETGSAFGAQQESVATGRLPVVAPVDETPSAIVPTTTGAVPIVGFGGAAAPQAPADDEEEAVFAVDWAEAGGPPRARGTYVAPSEDEEYDGDPSAAWEPAARPDAAWPAESGDERRDEGGLDPELEHTAPLADDEYGPYRRR